MNRRTAGETCPLLLAFSGGESPDETIVWQYAQAGFGGLSLPAVIQEGKIPLSEVLPSAGAEIRYVYDFGDYWEHLIELEEIVRAQPEFE